MTDFSRAVAGGVVLGVLVTTTACSTSPSREKAAERFAIEIAARYGVDRESVATQEAADAFAGDAVDGRCNDADYWRLATSPLAEEPWDADLQYVWAASCSVLYGESFRDDLEKAYMDTVVGGITND